MATLFKGFHLSDEDQGVLKQVQDSRKGVPFAELMRQLIREEKERQERGGGK